MSKPQVIVIGAGIVGAASAIWLRRAGMDVTLIDKNTPGMGASYGNGGILARCSVVPVTTPGLLRKAPQYLFDPNSPLFLRWGYLPKLMSWLPKYLAHANERDTRRISKGLGIITSDSLEQHQALSRGTSAEKWLKSSDYSFVYRDRAAFEADHFGWELRRAEGFDPEIVEGGAVGELEPNLSPDMQFLAVNKDHGYILNPGRYVQELVKVLEDEGGRFVQADVQDIVMSGDRIQAVDTDQGRFTCDRAVIALGVWSKALTEKLGVKVPLEAERGYHIVYKNAEYGPRNPMMLTAGKFVAAPMDEGVRCAGIVEFGGLSPKRSKGPLKLLRKSVKELFPNMRADAQDEWMGFRPAPTDSLPLIGEIQNSGIFTAFGHHHIGLTGGPKTGRIVADLITGNKPNIDLSAFEPMRFAN